MTDQHDGIEWRDGVPVSRRFQDPYYSLQNGLDETRHVFLAGNGLPDRLRPGFHVAELGFGTGLNLLALLTVARRAGRAEGLRYTAFEAWPLSAPEIETALAPFDALGAERATLVRHAADTVFEIGGISVELVIGDAAETLPAWDGRADAWFLDGFAPARNPELWAPEILREVARHTLPGGTAATYTAAGHVRRELAEAGFEVTRQAGYGRKRHMTVARRL